MKSSEYVTKLHFLTAFTQYSEKFLILDFPSPKSPFLQFEKWFLKTTAIISLLILV